MTYFHYIHSEEDISKYVIEVCHEAQYNYSIELLIKKIKFKNSKLM